MKKSILVMSVLIFIAGCTPELKEAIRKNWADTPPPLSIADRSPESFTEEALEPYRKQGNSVITGQAFLLVTTHREPKFAAGCEVCLVPASNYIERYIDQFENLRTYYVGPDVGKPTPFSTDLDSRLRYVTKTNVADGHGNFEFKNLPPGAYTAFCLMPSAQRTVPFIVHKTITLSENDAEKIILTKEIDGTQL